MVLLPLEVACFLQPHKPNKTHRDVGHAAG